MIRGPVADNTFLALQAVLAEDLAVVRRARCRDQQRVALAVLAVAGRAELVVQDAIAKAARFSCVNALAALGALGRSIGVSGEIAQVPFQLLALLVALLVAQQQVAAAAAACHVVGVGVGVGVGVVFAAAAVSWRGHRRRRR